MEPHESEPLDSELAWVRERVKELPAPPADAEFRARLRAEFASGRLEMVPVRPERLVWYRRPMTHWTLAAAAAVAALLSTLALNQGPSWQVTSEHGGGEAIVDGRPVEMGRAGDFDRRVRAGVRVILPEHADLMLRAGNSIMIEVAPGTDFTVPSVPGRWFGRLGRGEVHLGELRLSTGAAFHGGALALSTPEAQVRVTGTTLAVICEPTGTCVCVLEGVVRVGAARDSMTVVPAGMRAYVFADGRPTESTYMRPTEEPALGALRDLRRAAMEHARR